MDNGYVLLHRKLFSNRLWLSEKFTKAQAWVDLFANANHADGHFWVRGIRVDIKRGQIGWSELTMAQRWGWSRNKVRRFLSYLVDERQVNIETIHQNMKLKSIITILNYDAYQKRDNKQDNRKTSNDTTDDTGTKNVKEELKNKQQSDVPSHDVKTFIDSFKEINPSHERLFRNTTERSSAERLLKKYGLSKMLATVENLPEIISKPYAPRITTPYELEKNLGKLLIFVEQNKNIIKTKQPNVIFS